jgi:hypothetical protein
MSDEMDKDGRLPTATWKQVKQAISDLRGNGYAVVLFNPDELEGCPADELESNLVGLAWEEIDHIKQAMKDNAQ